MFLAIFMLWKKYSRMLIVCSGNCFPILVMWIRIFLAGPTKPTWVVRTIICPGKTFVSFNCERKLVICYSAIYYSWTSGSQVKTIFLGYFWCVWTLYWLRIKIRTVPLGFNRFWFGHLWSFRLRFDTESSEQVESEHAVSLQFVVVSALVTLACPSELSGLKKVVTRADVVFVFFSRINSLTIFLDA